MAQQISRIKLNKDNKIACYEGRTKVDTLEMHGSIKKGTMKDLVEELVVSIEEERATMKDLIAIADTYDAEAEEEYGFEGEEDEDEGEAGEEDEGEESEVAMTVKAKYRQAYKANKNTCGDKLAFAMTEATTVMGPKFNKKGEQIGDKPQCSYDLMRKVCKANGIVDRYEENWSTHNAGHCRMIVRNVLAGMIDRGLKVVVGSQTWKENATQAKKHEAKVEKQAERLATLRAKKNADKKPAKKGKAKKK